MSIPVIAMATTMALTLALSSVLLAYKFFNTWRKRFAAVSRASYIAVFGELTARGGYPQDILATWTNDPVFREALVDFMRLLDGLERDRLLRVARDLGIVDEAVTALQTARRGKQRVRAATVLAELADPHTVEPLMHALHDDESGVRINASAALARIGEPDLVEPILANVDRESEWDAARTMDQLAALGGASVPGLLAYLGDLNERIPTYGRLAIQTLGVIGDIHAEPILLHALASPDLELRLSAAGALQSCGTTRCVVPLIAALADPDGRVRARAAKSLGAHFDGRAVEPLYVGLHDREWWVRKNSAASLVHLPGGVDALQRALRANDHFARDAAREQLMTLGIPAGGSGEAEAAEEPAGSWIDDQLRALETRPDELAGDADGHEVPDWMQEQMAQLEQLDAAKAPEVGLGSEDMLDVALRSHELIDEYPRQKRAG